MAINLDERYPGRANPKTLSYPQGSFKNRTSPTSKDGTYLEQDWANDQLAFFQSLMQDAGITANGQVDTVEASQYFDALVQAIGNRFPKFVTFTEATALTEDIGPIIVIGMDGIWEWNQSTYFTGYRHPYCGMWMDGWTPTPLPFQIAATGGTWRESDEKERRVIARYRESGLVAPSASWIKGQNMIADIGGGNWKAPDLQDMFKRMSGTDVDTANARTLGARQEDAIRNIVGTFHVAPAGASHALITSSSGAFSSTGDVLQAPLAVDASGTNNRRSGVVFDASGVVRTSTENRPASSAIAPFIHV